MPVNYRIQGEVATTPSPRPYRNDWSPLHRSIDQLKQAEAAKARQAADELAAKAKMAAEEALYKPEAVEDIDYNASVERDARNVLSHAVNAYREGSIGSPQYNMQQGLNKSLVNLKINKGKAAIASYNDAYGNIKALPNYVNKDALNTEVYALSHPKNPDGSINFEAIDPQSISNVPANYYKAINTSEMYGDKLKALEKMARNKEIQYQNENPSDPNSLINTVYSDDVQAKFLTPTYDKNGRFIKMVPGVTDKHVQYFLDNDDEMRREAEVRVDQRIEQEAENMVRDSNGKISMEQAIKDLSVNKGKYIREHIRTNLENHNASQLKTESKVTQVTRPGGGDSDKVTVTTEYDRPANYQLSGERGVVTGWVPEQKNLTGKGLDKPMNITTEENLDIQTSGRKKIVGVQKVYPNSLQYLPYRMVNGKVQIAANPKEEVTSEKGIKYGWFMQGQNEFKEEVEGGKLVDKKETTLIPYEQVKEKIKTQYGYSLEDRPLTEYSDRELANTINEQYPKATAQQKKAIFDKLRAQ